MYSTKKTSALVAAAALMALAPASAMALKQAAPAGGCRVSMFAEPRVVTNGESAQLFGQVLCGPATSAVGQTVTVYEHSVGTPGFHVLGTPTSGVGGFYAVLAPGLSTNTSFYATITAARSVTRAIVVAPLVTIKGPPQSTQLLTGVHNEVTFTGTVSPADVGAQIVLQRENSTGAEEWGQIQLGTVGPGGIYAIRHRFLVPGQANVRVVIPAHRRFTVRGVSDALSYDISQAENPKLTINAKQDPIFFGQTITLEGNVKAGAGVQLTLMARNHIPGSPFTAIAKATSGPGGQYSFPQVPQESTSYKVTGGGISDRSRRGCQICPHGQRDREHRPVRLAGDVLRHGHSDRGRPRRLPRARKPLRRWLPHR